MFLGNPGQAEISRATEDELQPQSPQEAEVGPDDRLPSLDGGPRAGVEDELPGPSQARPIAPAVRGGPAPRGRQWSITFYLPIDINVREWIENLNTMEIPDLEYLTGQIEVTENDQLHFQGAVKFTKRMYMNAVLRALKMEGAHIEVARDWDRLVDYVNKLITSIENLPRIERGTYIRNNEKASAAKVAKKRGCSIQDVIRSGTKSQRLGNMLEYLVEHKNTPAAQLAVTQKIPETMFSLNTVSKMAKLQLRQESKVRQRDIARQAHLKPWQRQLFNELMQPASPRKIIIYKDEVGNSGKSWFLRFISDLYPDETLFFTCGKYQDHAYALHTMAGNVRFVFNDVTRSTNDEKAYVNYTFLESVKNCTLTSAKYESTIIKLENVPHVIIFTNSDIDYKKFSADRIDLRVINEDKTVTYMENVIGQDNLVEDFKPRVPNQNIKGDFDFDIKTAGFSDIVETTEQIDVENE